jgi:Putative MetA-pathway of phenol degradation
MTYLTGDIPIGNYDTTRLANLGIGHGALGGSGGYTYFNPQTGREFSAATDLTYNFINQALQYQNGIDFHLDWGASQFLSKEFLAGLVGYFFNQVTGDSGSGARPRRAIAPATSRHDDPRPCREGSDASHGPGRQFGRRRHHPLALCLRTPAGISQGQNGGRPYLHRRGRGVDVSG